MVYKIQLKKTVLDPAERRVRLNELFKVFSEELESKTVDSSELSRPGESTVKTETAKKKSH